MRIYPKEFSLYLEFEDNMEYVELGAILLDVARVMIEKGNRPLDVNDSDVVQDFRGNKLGTWETI